MLSPEDIRRKAERRFPAFLRYKLETELFYGGTKTEDSSVPAPPELFFPWEIPAGKEFRTRSPAALAGVGRALSELRRRSKESSGTGYSLVFETAGTRRLGTQTILEKVVFETEKDYLSFLKQGRAAALFLENARTVYRRFPFCEDWIRSNLNRLQEPEAGKREPLCWEHICLCVRWFLEHPASGLYIREIPLPVHTKFIETHKDDILSLFRFMNNTGGDGFGGSSCFEDEFCLKRDEPFIRSRAGERDIGLPLSVFAGTKPEAVREVFVIENKMVYLTFPLSEGRLCIFGSGFQVSALSRCRWLSVLSVYYFGDLDEHGFAILSRFREDFPHVRSFCMDLRTLEEFGGFRVAGKPIPSETPPDHLTEEEGRVFSLLRSDPLRNRLEQERIPLSYVVSRLGELH